MLKFVKCRRGSALVEYGIIVGLIAVLAITAVLGLGERTQNTFDTVTANLNWSIDGVSGDFAARYRFTTDVNPGNSDMLGYDLSNLAGSPWGGLDEARFDTFDIRSIQHDAGTDELTVIMAGNTTAQTSGYHLVCIDLTNGETPLVMDFDTTTGNYFGVFSSTIYVKSVAQPPFDLDQELACVVEAK